MTGGLWSIWMLGGISVIALCISPLYRWEVEKYQLHYESCFETFMRNKDLLSKKDLCDGGTHELAQRDKVDCAGARRENLWGPGWCALWKWWDRFFISRWVVNAKDSWFVSGLIMVVAVFWIRSWWNHRSEVAKHRITADAWHRTAEQMQFQRPASPTVVMLPPQQPQMGGHGYFLQAPMRGAIVPSPPMYRGQQHHQITQGYVSDGRGGVVYLDNTGSYYN